MTNPDYYGTPKEASREERNTNTAQEIREWIEEEPGWFRSEKLDAELGFRGSERDMSNRRQVIRRLLNSGELIKHNRDRGCYRKRQVDYIKMDFKNAPTAPMSVDWPLMIGDFFVTYPKNICVVAGCKDAGKTTFFLDFIKRNMKDHRIVYFSSEMGPQELRMRLDKHEDITLEEWEFEAFEESDNFADAVYDYRNDIIIIDYIEVNQEFSAIGDKIKAIHEQLEGGIALIGIQKQYGATWGRGGEFSNQRPRLYVTIESGIARIRVAKNRVDGVENPVGNLLEYKIVNGWKMIPSGIWHPEYDSGQRGDRPGRWG